MTKSLLSPRLQREFAIAVQAKEIALRHFPEGRVEPEAIAAREGIGFRYASFPEEFDGILVHDAGRFYIVCNERRAPRGSPRGRFTFAHELGHYFLEDHRTVLSSGRIPALFSLSDYVSSKPIERESDHFAAHLLMPFASFLSAAAGHEPGLAQIAALASTFGTSVTATAFHALAADLLPAPAAVFRWDYAGHPLGRRISSETYDLDRAFRRLPRSFPDNSATATAIRDQMTGPVTAVSDCQTWFPDLYLPQATANLPLREEVMALGRFGWLTVVYNPSRP